MTMTTKHIAESITSIIAQDDCTNTPYTDT
jgi:hypothetical protein